MTSLTDLSTKFRYQKLYHILPNSLDVKKVTEHQRNCALAVLKERDVFKAKPTGSEKITDLPNNLLGTRLHESSFFER